MYDHVRNYSPAFILFHGHLLTLRISPAMFGCVVGFGPSPQMTTPWCNEVGCAGGCLGSEGCNNTAKSNMPTFKIPSQRPHNGVLCCGAPWVRKLPHIVHTSLLFPLHNFPPPAAAVLRPRDYRIRPRTSTSA